MARRVTVIDREREQGKPLLVLDAGNSLIGDQDPARKTLGETSVTVMNMMGYDAMGLGPTDLALGLAALRERMDKAQFAVLSANAVESATGELVAEPYLLRQFDNHTIAIVAVSGSSAKGSDTNQESETPEITVRDPFETARTLVPQLMPQADVIVLLSTAGQDIDQQIAEGIPGVDLIIGGDAYRLTTPWRAGETGTLILHADDAYPGHAGRRVGIAHLAFDKGGQLVADRWQRLNLGPEIATDADMASWVQEQTMR